MDFVHRVQHIQQKPEYVRRRILVISVIVGMALVVGGWLMTVNRRIGDISLFSKPQPEQTQHANSPFRMIKDIVENAANDMRGQLFKK